MPAVQTGYEHISLDERKTPIIAGTTLKVIELIQEKLAYGWSPEEIQFQHPSLTLGLIYSALAYYATRSNMRSSGGWNAQTKPAVLSGLLPLCRSCMQRA